jgi:hypothetical protein
MYALELDSLDKFPEELNRPFVSYASSFDHCAKMVVAWPFRLENIMVM